MATVTGYGTTATAVNGTWTNISNAVYSPGSFASLTTSTAATYTFDVGGFDFWSRLPSDAIIDQVRVTVRHYVSQTNRWSAPSVQAFVSGSGIGGTTTSLTLSNNSSNTQTIVMPGLSMTQLGWSTFAIRYSISKSGNQSATANVDFIQVDIDYRTESWQEIKL